MPQSLPLVPRNLPDKINSLPCDALARHTGFVRRNRGKITAAGFLKTACLFALASSPSLASFAKLWALLNGDTLSKQAVAKRCSAAAVAFLESALRSVIDSVLHPVPHTDPLPGGFRRILVQDSTNLTLPDHLATLFPGPSNQSFAKRSSLKIQAVLDLLTNHWVRFKITPFTCNDQSASPDILDQLEPGDLVIRDLGYLSLDVFRRIHEGGAYFLSRWRFGLRIALPESSDPIDLLDLLRGHERWDGWVHVGEARLPMRLVAKRLPETVAAERRRKARANRDKRLAHNPAYYELLGWNIFITNVPEAMASVDGLVQLYALRWRIEIVFKAWKSHFRLDRFTDGSPEQILVVVLGKLIWICWFTVHFNALVLEGLEVSLLKLAQWWSAHALQVFLPESPDADTLNRITRYYCRYERRRDRHNYLEKLEAALG
jgi:hypothetical protein